MSTSSLMPQLACPACAPRQRRREARFVVAFLLSLGLVLTLAGCGSSAEPETKVSSEKSTSTTTTPSPEEVVTDLEGTWSTDPVTMADMAKTLRAAGRGDSVAAFTANAPITDAPTVLTLEIADDWDLNGQAQGGQLEEIDFNAGYSVAAAEVVVTHSAGSNTFRWSVTDDVLRLTWLRTTFTEALEEVIQRALYMTADFHRTS